MPVSGKVQADQSARIADYENAPDGTTYVIGPAGKKFSVYADATGYSQTSGQTLGRGLVERDTEGKPVRFRTVELAKKWVRAGLPVADRFGNSIDWQQWGERKRMMPGRTAAQVQTILADHNGTIEQTRAFCKLHNYEGPWRENESKTEEDLARHVRRYHKKART